MAESTIRVKGQTTVPLQVRNSIGAAPGTRLVSHALADGGLNRARQDQTGLWRELARNHGRLRPNAIIEQFRQVTVLARSHGRDRRIVDHKQVAFGHQAPIEAAVAMSDFQRIEQARTAGVLCPHVPTSQPDAPARMRATPCCSGSFQFAAPARCAAGDDVPGVVPIELPRVAEAGIEERVVDEKARRSLDPAGLDADAHAAFVASAVLADYCLGGAPGPDIDLDSIA